MIILDNYLYGLQEGKIWDKVKKVWRDHKGKIIAGAAVAAGGIAYANRSKGNKNVSNTSSRQQKPSRRSQLIARQKNKLRQKGAIAKSKCPGQKAYFSMGKLVGCGEAGKLAANKMKDRFLGKTPKSKQNIKDNEDF